MTLYGPRSIVVLGPVRTALAVAVALVLAVSRAAAFSSGPPDGFAGEPPSFSSCTACHGDGKPGNGSLSILNIPLQYEPNATYTLAVQLGDPGQMRWGFELTALDDATLFQAGTLTLVDKVTTQLSDHPMTDPDYLKQTMVGTFSGVPDGPVSWNFQWTAPAAGSVTFYVAGNAANGNGSADGGDEIYTIQVPVAPPVSAVPVGSPAFMTRLEPSFPNPFRPATAIPFTLVESAEVALRVYGVDGRLIANLIDGERPAGHHVVPWDGRDLGGQRVPSGVYFLVLRANGAAGGVESRQQVVVAE